MFLLNPYSLGWLKDQCNKFLVGINELKKIIRSKAHPMSKSMHCLPWILFLTCIGFDRALGFVVEVLFHTFQR